VSIYELSRFNYELRKPDMREAFQADPDAHLARYELTSEERALVDARDWEGLVGAGVSTYVLANFARATGLSFYELGAALRGETPEQLGSFVEQQSQRIAEFAILPKETVNG
jgi:hypothetical protein